MKFSAKKTFKRYWKTEKNAGKSGNFISPEKWEPI